MSSRAKKIVCRASWRDPIYARFLQVSFSTVSYVFGGTADSLRRFNASRESIVSPNLLKHCGTGLTLDSYRTGYIRSLYRRVPLWTNVLSCWCVERPEVTCPLFPHTSYYDIRIADGVACGETVVAVAVGKGKTRSVFQGGEATVFSTALCAAHFARE